jgi:hypothetical protein
MRRVEFRPGEIKVKVTNPQREDVTIATVTVDDAVVPYTLDGDRTIGRLRSTTIVIPFDWVDGEPLSVGVTSSTGIQTTKEIAAAVETPQASAKGFFGYAVSSSASSRSRSGLRGCRRCGARARSGWPHSWRSPPVC